MKSSSDLSIGDLAARFGLATHVLRHWEAAGLLTPATRVNGRRRYTADHVTRVAIIMRAKSTGFSLDQIREVLTVDTGEQRRALLRLHRDALDERIRQAEAQKRLVDHVLECAAADFLGCPNFLALVEELQHSTPVEQPAP